MRLIKQVAVAVALSASVMYQPAEANSSRWTVYLNGMSKHLQTDYKFNELNLGLGIAYRTSHRSSYILGYYRNSYGNITRYVGRSYTFADVGFGKYGVDIGLVDGYSQSMPVPDVVPVIAQTFETKQLKFNWFSAVGTDTGPMQLLTVQLKLN